MDKEGTLKQIKRNFDDDLKKEISPLYDIEQSVHENTVRDLKELFEAVGDFAYTKALSLKQKQQDDKLKEFEEKVDKKIRSYYDTKRRLKNQELKDLSQNTINTFRESKQIMREIFVK